MMMLEQDQSVTWLTVLEQVGRCHCVLTLYPVCHLRQVSQECRTYACALWGCSGADWSTMAG